MSTMFQPAFFSRNIFWMGNGGRGGRAFTGGEPEPYRYCDPAMEPCPLPLVSPVAYPPAGAFVMSQQAAAPQAAPAAPPAPAQAGPHPLIIGVGAAAVAGLLILVLR